jgi:hypothetical protein
VPLARLSRESGQDWRQRLDEEKINRLSAEGLLEFKNETLRPTMAGLQRLNGILSHLL